MRVRRGRSTFCYLIGGKSKKKRLVDLVMTCWCKKHKLYVLRVSRRRKVRGGVLWYNSVHSKTNFKRGIIEHRKSITA